jgi:hypothetical protein
VALERLQRELGADRTVTLIGDREGPAWCRWRTAERSSRYWLEPGAPGPAFTAHSPSLGLLELLPDVPRESYRFSAQVRHLQSERTGEVGLFFDRRAYPGPRGDLHIFTEVTFNDVLNLAQALAPAVKPKKVPDNAVHIGVLMYSDPVGGKRIEKDVCSAGGPSFQAGGEGRAKWRDLEVIVTPDEFTVRWDGEAFSLPRRRIPGATEENLSELRQSFPNDPFLQRLQPKFDGRGGLGLYVRRGAASFRAVTVGPPDERP